MTISGDTIENEINLTAVTTKMEKILMKEKIADQSIDKDIWTRTKWISLITIGLTILSMIISIASQVKTLNVIIFLLSVTVFVINLIFANRIADKTHRKVSSDIEEDIKNTKTEIQIIHQIIKRNKGSYSATS